MNLRTIAAFISSCFLLACNDSTAPHDGTGKYALGWYSVVSIDGVTTEDVRAPLIPGVPSDFMIDSLADTVALNTDYTYRELGTVWGSSRLGTQTVVIPIEVSGTYQLDGPSIVLIPSIGSTMTGGIGRLENGRLTFDRYPGSWSFVKR